MVCLAGRRRGWMVHSNWIEFGEILRRCKSSAVSIVVSDRFYLICGTSDGG